MSPISFKLFALVAGYILTLVIALVRWPAPALNLCKSNLLGTKNFHRLMKKRLGRGR